MAARAAVGFRAHSGWAAAVAVAEPADAPVVVARSHIEMVDRSVRGGPQPYHASVGLDISKAEQIVTNCAAHAARLAQRALAGLLEDLGKSGFDVRGCALLLASGRKLPALPGILASHALIHTAEGELFREALRTASRECGMPVASIVERDLFTQASADLGIPPDAVQRRLSEIGKAIGPPWRQDEKYAATAAWWALGAHVRER